MYNDAKTLLAFKLILLSVQWTFSKCHMTCDNMFALVDNETCICLLFLKMSVLMSSKVNIDKSLWNQPSKNFKGVKRSWVQKFWELQLYDFNALKFETCFLAQHMVNSGKGSGYTWKIPSILQFLDAL